jgi:hypothetical protein
LVALSTAPASSTQPEAANVAAVAREGAA